MTRKTNPFRVLLLALSIVAGASVLAFGAAFLALKSYLGSPQPGTALSLLTSRFLGVEGRFANLAINGFSASAAGYAGSGSRLVQRVRADDITGGLDPFGFLSRTWRIEHIRIARLDLAVQPGQSADTSAAPPPTKPENAWWRSFIPNQVALDRFSAHSLHLRWPTGSGTGRLDGAELEARPRGRDWLIIARRGNITIDGVPGLRLTDLRVVWNRDRTKIERCELSPEGHGTISITGEISEERSLRIVAANVDIQPWIPQAAHPFLSGSLDVDAKLKRPSPRASEDVSGRVSLNAARLQKHPAMEKVASYTRTPQYRDLMFQVAEARFRTSGDMTELQELKIESRGLLRIEGSGMIRGQTIDAEMDVGVPSAALRFLPGAGSQVFDRDRNGYRWARVRIQGPLDNPDQDLVSRLINAPFNMLLSSVTGILTDTVPNTLNQTSSGVTTILRGGIGIIGGAAQTVTTGKTETLTRGTQSVVEGAGEILNILNPFSRREPRR